MGSDLRSVGAYRVDGPVGALGGWFRASAPAASERPALVLVHGMHQSAEHWRALEPHLPADRAVLAPEYRGHGRSTPQGPHGLVHYVADVLSAISAHELDEVHLVGTSFGGSVAVGVAATLGPRARSVTALASSRHTGKGRAVSETVAFLRKQGVRGFFSYTVPRYTLPPGTPEAVIAAHVDAVVAERTEDTVAAVFEGTYGTDIEAEARRVQCSGLVVSGALDRTCPVASGAELAAVLGCEHRVLPGVAHVPAVECPEVVGALLVEHIAGAERPVPAR